MLDQSKRIYDDITQTIGNTPLVRLQRFGATNHACANLMGKVEYFNPAGSIKDRPAMAMIDALIDSPDFSEKTEIIEATSGNNGVACAWICAMRNIPLTIVIPEHMSIERRKLIQLYGGKIVTTPKHLGTKGAIDKAKEMVAERPHAVMLDQFANQANPTMHSISTAQEIWHDTGGQVDVVIAGVGTGGTITGIAEALKEMRSTIEMVAVEPASCPVLTQGRAGTHKIQGLSSGHVPDILNTAVLDRILTVEDEVAIHTARQLARLEGLPVGISSGAVAAAALVLATQAEYQGKNIVCILADNAERYFSTELFADIG